MMFYFYSGILQVGNLAELKSSRITYIKQNYKITKNSLIYFQDNLQKRYCCSVQKIKSSYLQFLVEKEVSLVKNKNEMHLFIPIIAKQELDWLLYKATELGVTSINFFESDYSYKIFKGAKLMSKLKSWRELCQRACENSGRAILPEIEIAGSFKNTILNLQKTNQNFYLLHPETKEQKLDISFEDKVAIVVGPKKGFTTKELKNINCKKISLGMELLKSETAALTMIAIFNYGFARFQLK